MSHFTFVRSPISRDEIGRRAGRDVENRRKGDFNVRESGAHTHRRPGDRWCSCVSRRAYIAGIRTHAYTYARARACALTARILYYEQRAYTQSETRIIDRDSACARSVFHEK